MDKTDTHTTVMGCYGKQLSRTKFGGTAQFARPERNTEGEQLP